MQGAKQDMLNLLTTLLTILLTQITKILVNTKKKQQTYPKLVLIWEKQYIFTHTPINQYLQNNWQVKVSSIIKSQSQRYQEFSYTEKLISSRNSRNSRVWKLK